LDPSQWLWSTGDDDVFDDDFGSFGVVTFDPGSGAVVENIASGFNCGE
jgi:hypothetical protein